MWFAKNLRLEYFTIVKAFDYSGIYDRRNNILKSEIISATPVDLRENRQEDQIKDAVTQHPEVVYRALTSKETQHSTILYVILFAAYLIGWYYLIPYVPVGIKGLFGILKLMLR